MSTKFEVSKWYDERHDQRHGSFEFTVMTILVRLCLFSKCDKTDVGILQCCFTCWRAQVQGSGHQDSRRYPHICAQDSEIFWNICQADDEGSKMKCKENILVSLFCPTLLRRQKHQTSQDFRIGHVSQLSCALKSIESFFQVFLLTMCPKLIYISMKWYYFIWQFEFRNSNLWKKHCIVLGKGAWRVGWWPKSTKESALSWTLSRW